jgi:hypothetical protein
MPRRTASAFGLAARAHVELAVDGRDLVADRLLDEEEAQGDLRVASPSEPQSTLRGRPLRLT